MLHALNTAHVPTYSYHIMSHRARVYLRNVFIHNAPDTQRDAIDFGDAGVAMVKSMKRCPSWVRSGFSKRMHLTKVVCPLPSLAGL